MPEITGEIHTCPHRSDDVVDEDSWYVTNGFRSCTFCGSMEPDEVSGYIREHGTDKLQSTADPNELHVDKAAPNTYHRWHDTHLFLQDLGELGWAP